MTLGRAPAYKLHSLEAQNGGSEGDGSKMSTMVGGGGARLGPRDLNQSQHGGGGGKAELGGGGFKTDIGE